MINTLKIKEIVYLYQTMQDNGVILYGGGREGELAVSAFRKEGIVIKAIGDQDEGKRCGDYRCISLEELCGFERNVVCIITPAASLTEVRRRLSQHYDVVISNDIVHWMQFFVPDENGKGLNYYRNSFPFNHYESPYVSCTEIEIIQSEENEELLLDIELNRDKQLEFIPSIVRYGKEFLDKKTEEKFRYKSDNSYFNLTDALVLNSVIREFKQRKIIEIGSGLSTCVMLDTNENWCGNRIQIDCIEPYPDRLRANIRNIENHFCIQQNFVQDISLENFEELENNDILFIDSSHVIKAGGDLPYEYFQIIPRLKSGVLIHIHDIFSGFTYPLDWLKEGRAYTEGFLLRAFLMNNKHYEILFFNHMMDKELKKAFHDCNVSIPAGGSIYLRKK